MEANKNKNKRIQNSSEERANAATHAIGILFIVFTLPFLWNKTLDHSGKYTLFAISIYIVGMLSVYISSTLYHFFTNPTLKSRAHIADHISIFLLIGGTYTPVVYLFTPLKTSLIFLGIMWGIIAIGIILKVFFTGRFKWLSTSIYVALGWMLVFLFNPLKENMNLYVFLPILWGGLAYTIGVLFYIQNKMKFSHAIWHIFVLAGTVFHWFAVYRALDF